MQKEDFIKVLMNKNDELAHLPPKFYDTTKSLVSKTGSSEKLSENLSKALCSKLKTEGVKDSIHEGFEPIMCLEEIMVKYVKMAIDKLMESSRTQGFESFKNSMKEIFHKGVGEAFDELKDGFKNED
jgi:hypothetical protein